MGTWASADESDEAILMRVLTYSRLDASHDEQSMHLSVGIPVRRREDMAPPEPKQRLGARHGRD
jgi:hypothetical protein